MKSFFRIKKAKNQGLNVVDGIVKAKNLHKKLALIVHPDKNVDNQEKALRYTQLVNQNRYNYEMLLKLEQEINEIFHCEK